MDLGTESWRMDDILQPQNFDDFGGSLSRNEGDPEFFFDNPIEQQAIQDFDLLFATDHALQPFFSSDARKTAQLVSEADSPYPAEFNIHHNLVGELGFDPSDIEQSHNQSDWHGSDVDLELHQPNSESFPPPTNETRPQLLEWASGGCGRFPWPLTSSGEHVSAGSGDGGPALGSPSRADALRALIILKNYFNSGANRLLLQPQEHDTLNRLNQILRAPAEYNRCSSNSPKQDHGSKVGRAIISSLQKNTLNDFFKAGPYPTADSVENFSAQVGLPVRTVKTWFANARARKEGIQRK
jgi:hypothetical protein